MVSIALDVAASGKSVFNLIFSKLIYFILEFHLESKPGFYDMDIKDKNKSDHRIFSGDEMVEYYLSLVEKYPSTFIH